MMNRRGFSLVEVLVSVVILAFMGMLIYESLSQASAAKEENEAALDRYQAVRVALSRVARDLSMAFLSKHKDPQLGTDKFRTIFRGDRDKMRKFVDSNTAQSPVVAGVAALPRVALTRSNTVWP